MERLEAGEESTWDRPPRPQASLRTTGQSSSSYSLLVVQILVNRLLRLLREVQISVVIHLVRELRVFLLEVLLLEVLTFPLILVGRQSLSLLGYFLLFVSSALVQDELLPPLDGVVHLGGQEGL